MFMEPLSILFAVAIVFISFALRLKLGDNMIEGSIGYPYLIFVLVGCGIFRKVLDGYVSRFIQVGSWADVGEVIAWILGFGMGIGLAVSAAKLADTVRRIQSEDDMDQEEDPREVKYY
jgi:hypothetical protein